MQVLRNGVGLQPYFVTGSECVCKYERYLPALSPCTLRSARPGRHSSRVELGVAARDSGIISAFAVLVELGTGFSPYQALPLVLQAEAV